VVMVSHLLRREIHVGAVAVVIHRGSSCGMALGDFLNRVIAQFVLNFQVLGGRAQIAQIQGLFKGAKIAPSWIGKTASGRRSVPAQRSLPIPSRLSD
jgi:hypothetical protein